MGAQDYSRRRRPPFTSRQRQILGLVALGMSDKEIGLQLGLSPYTVRTHLQRFYRDHGLHSRTQAAMIWLQNRTTGQTT